MYIGVYVCLYVSGHWAKGKTALYAQSLSWSNYPRGSCPETAWKYGFRDVQGRLQPLGQVL